jgi:cytochrome b561
MPGVEGRRQGHHPGAKALHWITALAVLGLLGVGLWMTDLPLGLLKLEVYGWHKWIGLVVLVLTAARLWWRWRHPPPALPGPLPAWECRAAHAAHWTLFFLLLAMPISGWLMNSAAGVGLYWFGYVPIPDLVPRDPALFETLRTVHRVLSRLLDGGHRAACRGSRLS